MERPNRVTTAETLRITHGVVITRETRANGEQWIRVGTPWGDSIYETVPEAEAREQECIAWHLETRRFRVGIASHCGDCAAL